MGGGVAGEGWVVIINGRGEAVIFVKFNKQGNREFGITKYPLIS